ncbi:MAG: hypothetical protein QOD65_163 [Gaiellales bacterium]|nr:hypothetical protein [Gaiellales bacterium]
MTKNLHQRLRRATGLGAFAMLALPLAAQAADYRAQLSESFNSGLAAARPSITLRAVIDNGAGAPPAATGIVRFNLDTRHLTSSAWASMLAAGPGTQLGAFSSELTGVSAVRVLSQGKDTGGSYVRAGIDVPGTTASIIGDDNLVAVVRRTPSGSYLTFTLDIRTVVGKLAARAAGATLQNVTLALRSSIVYSGKSHGITLNPASPTALTNSVNARMCLDPACATVAPSTTSSATVHLPKTVTIAAPVSAKYGYRYSIGGTGRSGDAVSLESLGSFGLIPARGATMVRPDGTFIIRATLRSFFSADGDLTLPARGRYAVASVEGGNATVYGIAGQDTHVVLAQPRFVLQRKTGGKLLHFSVRIPGADDHVRIAIKIGSKTLVQGYSSKAGTFAKTILKPAERGNLRVVASVPGADTAISNATPLSR